MANFRDMEIKDDGSRNAKEVIDIDVPTFLSGSGYTYKGVAEGNKVIAADKDGNEFDIDLDTFVPKKLEQQKIDLNNKAFNFAVNTPANPTKFESGATGMDRLLTNIAPEDITGNAQFLIDKYGKDNVAFSEKDGLLVKRGLEWMPVDPNNSPVQVSLKDGGKWYNPADYQFKKTLGNLEGYVKDPWELTRDLNDVATSIGQGVATGAAFLTGGAAAAAPATLVGGPVAGVLAFGAGGSIAAGATAAGLTGLRTLAGRAVGTYDADVPTTLKDIALETVTTMFAEPIAAGAKPTIKMVGGALKNMRNSASRAVFGELLGGMSGAGRANLDVAIDQTSEWLRKTIAVTKESASYDDAIKLAQNKALQHTENFLETATANLPKKFEEGMSQLKRSPKVSKVVFDADTMLSESAKEIQDSGLGVVEPIIKKGAKEVRDPFTGAVVEAASPDEISGYRFRAYTPEEQSLDPGTRSLLGETEVAEINKLVQELSGFKGQSFKGAQAVDQMVNVNKKINTLTNVAYKKKLSPEALRAYTIAQKTYKNKIRGSFNDAELGLDYQAVNDMYSLYSNPVDMARTALKSGDEKQVARVLDSFTSTSNSYVNRANQNKISLLADLAGEKGMSELNQVALYNSVAKTMPWIRPGTLTSLVITGSAATGNVPAVIGTAASMSPRIVSAAAVPTAKVAQGLTALADPVVASSLYTLDVLKAMSPRVRREAERNPEVMRKMFEATLQNAQGEIEGTNLMNQYIQDSLNKAQ